MGYPKSDEDRKVLVDRLLWQAHEQSLRGAERSPFWREGPWRCEFHRSAEAERLKLFSGDRCVYEEPVQGVAGAAVRSRELRRAVVHGDRTKLFQGLTVNTSKGAQ
jgi:hypothetical protein